MRGDPQGEQGQGAEQRDSDQGEGPGRGADRGGQTRREAWPGDPAVLKDMFARVEKVAEVKRKRGPLAIETYTLDVLEGPKGEVFDRSPPPELQ